MNRIENELLAGLRLLREFENQGDEGAGRALRHAEDLLMAPVEVDRSALPHRDIDWADKRATGKGGRRSTQEYRELAASYGFPLIPEIGWAPARDAARALEVARAEVEAGHINLQAQTEEGNWLEDFS